MAHELDMSNGRVNMAWAEGTETPWHELGHTIRQDAPIEEWQTVSGLDWSAMLADAEFKDLMGEYTKFPGQRVCFRSDTQAPLGVVSDKYKPVQPKQVLEFFRDLVGKFGGFTMNTAGSLFGGKKIWALAKADDVIDAGGGDKLLRYLLLATSFDLSTPTIVQHTSIRVVCANTHALALGMNEPRISVRHDADFNADEIKRQMMLDTDWADHVGGARAIDKSARLDKAWFGDNASVKDRAVQHAIVMSN